MLNIHLNHKILLFFVLFLQVIIIQGKGGDTLLLNPKLKKGDVLKYKAIRETLIKNRKPVVETKKFMFYIDSVSDEHYYLHYSRLLSEEDDMLMLAPDLKQEVDKIKLKFTLNYNGQLVSLTNEKSYYKECNDLLKKIASSYEKQRGKKKKKKAYSDLFFEYTFIKSTPHIEFAENLAAVFSTQITTVISDSIFKQKSSIQGISEGLVNGFHSTKVLKNKPTDSFNTIYQDFTADGGGYYNFVSDYLKSKYGESYNPSDAKVISYMENDNTKIYEQWVLEHHKGSGVNKKVNYERRFQIFDSTLIVLTQYKLSIDKIQ